MSCAGAARSAKEPGGWPDQPTAGHTSGHRHEDRQNIVIIINKYSKMGGAGAGLLTAVNKTFETTKI